MDSESPRPDEAAHALAERLDSLESEGWHVLHERTAPDGTSIDAIAVGPPGVCVIDLRGDVPRVELADRIASVAQVLGDEVETIGAVAVDHSETAEHRGAVEQPDGESDAETGGTGQRTVYVVEAAELPELLKISRPVHGPATVERLYDELSAAFPPAAAPAVRPTPAVGPRFSAVDEPTPMTPSDRSAERALGWYLGNSIGLYYASETFEGPAHEGHRVAILCDSSGRRLGTRDLQNGAVRLEPGVADGFAPLLLDSIGPTGVTVDRRAIPRVATSLPLATLFARLAGLWRGAVVGWVATASETMHAVLVHPGAGVVRLGSIDLATGRLAPASSDSLLGGATSPERLLAIVRDARPIA